MTFNDITPEMIEKAQSAANPAELLKLAEAEGLAMTMEQAEQYFAQLNPTKGELGDDELENVSGGACGRRWDMRHGVPGGPNGQQGYSRDLRYMEHPGCYDNLDEAIRL